MKLIKMIVFLVVVFLVGVVQAEEISPQLFLEQFVKAVQTQNFFQIRQLIVENPHTAEQVQRQLALKGKETGKKALSFRILAKALAKARKIFSSKSSIQGDLTVEELKFLKAFMPAYQAENIERMSKLVIKQPQIARLLQIRLMLLSKGVASKKARQIRNLAQVLGTILETWETQKSIDRLQTEAEQALDAGKYLVALKKFKQGLALTTSNKLRQQEAGRFLRNISVVYAKLHQYKQALKYLQQALKIFQELKNEEQERITLSDIGAIYNYLYQYKTALNYFQKALALHQKVKDKKWEANDLFNIGLTYSMLSQYESALEYFHMALINFHKLKDRKMKAETLNSLGVVFYELGRNPLDYFERSLTIFREIKDRSGEAEILLNLSVVHSYMSQYEQALEYQLQALTNFREIKDRSGEAESLSNLGMIYFFLKQYKRALEYFEQSLAIRRELKNHFGESKDLALIGFVYEKFGNYESAKSAIEESLYISNRFGLEKSLWVLQSQMGKIQAKLKQFSAAINYYQHALDTLEALRSQIKEQDFQLSFVQNKLFVYAEFINLLQNLHKQYPKKGYDKKALEIFERQQGRILLEELGKSGVRRFAGIPENILQRDREFEQQIAAIRKKRMEALAQSKDAEPQSKQLEKLEAEQAKFAKTLQTKYPAYYALKYPKPVTLENLQKQVLQAGEMMLIYNVRKDSTDLWIVGKQEFSMFNLALTKEQIQQQVTNFREVGIESMIEELEMAKNKQNAELKYHLQNAVDESLPEFVKVSHGLYQQLLPKAARDLISKADTIYIVPTGALYELPFEALITDPDEEEPHYLIQDYAIAYLSSASLLKTLREATKKRSDTEEREPFLAFADPVFQAENCGNNVSSQTSEVFQGLRTRAYRDLLGGGCIPQLPNTRDEALNIAKLFNVTPEELYLGERASRENVLYLNEDKELSDFSYILFATHAVLPDELSYINQPAVLLSYPENGGYLTMADVFGLEMNADLVTLSACNTGRGKNVKGEGVIGLTRAFMYAGTPAVSVSLWGVESQATQQLNQVLFSQLKNKRPLAESLRQAKLAMLKGKGKLDGEFEDIYHHPYFWAGFVVFGDGK